MAQLAAIGFGEGTGTTAADVSGNSRTVTAVPNWTTSQTGYGKCLTTTGNTSAGGRLPLPALTTYTFACRVRVRTSPAGSYATIIGHGDGTAPGTVHLLLNNLTPTVYYPNGGTFVPSGVTLTANSWYHLAYTYDGTSGFWVIDGVAAGAPVTTSQPIIVSAAGYYIGGSPSFPGDMEVDDVRVYDTAMSTAQIAAIKDVSIEAPAVASPAFDQAAFDSAAFFTPVSAAVAMASASTLAVTGSTSGATSVTLAGSSTLAVVGSETHPATVAFASSSAVAVTATTAGPTSIAFASSSTLSVTPAGSVTQLAAIGFGEGTGTTAADSSGNSRTVTAVPGWATSQSGYGKCLTTTGNTAAGGRLILPALSAYTFVMRIRARTSPAGSFATIFGHGDGTTAGTAHLLLNNLDLTCYWPNGSVFVPSGVTLTANQWYHVAFSYDGTSGFWTVDGAAAGAPVATAAGAQSVVASTTGWYIGGSPTFPSDMEVDDLRVYDGALTSAQVNALKTVSLEGAATQSATVAFASSSTLGVVATGGATTVPLVQSSTLAVTPKLTHSPAVTFASSSTLGVSVAGIAGLVGKRNMHPAVWSTIAACTYRLTYPVAVAARNLRLEFPNWATDIAGTGDTASGNTLTLGAVYVETTGGTLYPVQFGGSSSTTIASGGSATSDPVSGLTVAAGSTIYIRTYVTIPNGGRKPRLRCFVNYPTEASIPNSNQANATGTLAQASDNSTDQYGPVRIWGDVTAGQPQYAVAVVGDSITAGTGDDFANEADYGYWQRALWPGARPFEIYALAGEAADQFLTTQSVDRVPLINSYVNYVVNAYGINDLHSEGATLAQMQARCRAVAARDSTKRWYQITLTPTSTSTDNWATTGNQTPGYIQIPRQQFNDWVRDGMPETSGVAVATGTVGALRAGQTGHPYTGYIEVADAAETARNSSIWKANYTADGIHPTPTGHAAIASALNVATFADTTSTVVTQSATVALVQSSTFGVAGRQTVSPAVTFASSSTVAVTTSGTASSTVALSQLSALNVTASRVAVASVAFAQSSSVAVAAVTSTSVSITLSGASVLAVAGTLSRAAAVPFVSSSTLAASALLTHVAAVALLSTSSLSVQTSAPGYATGYTSGYGTPITAVAVRMASTSSLGVTGRKSIQTTVRMVGTSTLNISGFVGNINVRDIVITGVTEPVLSWLTAEPSTSAWAVTEAALGWIATEPTSGWAPTEPGILRVWTTTDPTVGWTTADPASGYVTTEPAI